MLKIALILLIGQIPRSLSYNETTQLLNYWDNQYPHVVKIAPIGKSKQGKLIWCIRLTNELDRRKKQRVLVAMSIHGNEPMAAAVGIGWFYRILHENQPFKKDLLNKREIYLVPIISPDTYRKSRHVEGVDPNRNFYSKNPCHPVACLQRFMRQMRFDAVISGHTHGRLMLYPYGDTWKKCEHHNQYTFLLNKMSRLNNYRVQKLSGIYGRPIIGVEDDWYYRGFMAFAITYEFGTAKNHSVRVPNYSDIVYETNRTYSSAIYFFCYAPFMIKK